MGQITNEKLFAPIVKSIQKALLRLVPPMKQQIYEVVKGAVQLLKQDVAYRYGKEGSESESSTGEDMEQSEGESSIGENTAQSESESSNDESAEQSEGIGDHGKGAWKVAKALSDLLPSLEAQLHEVQRAVAELAPWKLDYSY